jgi:hypothetical protein
MRAEKPASRLENRMWMLIEIALLTIVSVFFCVAAFIPVALISERKKLMQQLQRPSLERKTVPSKSNLVHN